MRREEKVSIKYTDDFLEFWVKYPSRWNEDSGRRYKVGKRKAFDVWRKLSAEEKEWALYAVRFVNQEKWIRDAHRWLRDGYFEDYELPNPEKIKREKVEKVERQKQEKRDEYGEYFSKMSDEELRKSMNSQALGHLKWLADEILVERQKTRQG